MFVFLVRLEGSTFVTTHESYESVEREASWVLRDFDLEEFNWLSFDSFDNDCCLDDYPDGSALILRAGTTPESIRFSSSALKERLKGEKSKKLGKYLSPFTGQWV